MAEIMEEAAAIHMRKRCLRCQEVLVDDQVCIRCTVAGLDNLSYSMNELSTTMLRVADLVDVIGDWLKKFPPRTQEHDARK